MLDAILYFFFVRLNENRTTLASRVLLGGDGWESAPRNGPLPHKRRHQSLRILSMSAAPFDDGEGKVLERLRAEGITSDGRALPFSWAKGNSRRSEYRLPYESRGEPIVAVRIKSSVGTPVKIQWVCDDHVK